MLKISICEIQVLKYFYIQVCKFGNFNEYLLFFIGYK